MKNFFKLNSVLVLLICCIGTAHAEGIAQARPYAAALIILIGITLDDLIRSHQ
jgi:hypothetical protein